MLDFTFPDSLIEIGLYLLNFAVLIVLVRLLVYKTIRKKVDERNKKFADIEDANKSMTARLAGMKSEYDAQIALIKQEAAGAGEEAARIASERGEALIKAAKQQAGELLARAEKEAEFEKERLIREIKAQAADIVVDITSLLLKREITASDNKKLIDDFLEEWEGIS